MHESLKRWLVVGLLMGTTVYALAEDITLTTYYPSPRGVYQELRTAGDMVVGSISGAPGARLHVIQDNPASAVPVFRADDETSETSPFIITSNGNVGIGMETPAERLVVNGGIQLGNSTGTNTGTLRWNGTDLQVFDGIGWINIGVPVGTIAFFNAASCPGGWSEVVETRGRYVVGIQPGASAGQPVGNELPLVGGGLMENRPVGQHTHTVPPGLLNDTREVVWQGAAGGGYPAYRDIAINPPMEPFWFGGIEPGFPPAQVDDAGVVPGTPAPYIQLLACQKN